MISRVRMRALAARSSRLEQERDWNVRRSTGIGSWEVRYGSSQSGAGQLSLGLPKDSSMLCMVRAMADCIISLATRAWRRFVVPARSVRM